MASRFGFWATLLLLPTVTAVSWSEALQDGQPVYACAGGSLLLPWNVSESVREEGIVDMHWFFDGRSQEMIAMFSAGNFLVTAPFSHRVEHVGNGGLYFERVGVEDSGNYTIEVSGHDASGAYFSFRHTAVVRIGDSLMTTDGELHASKEIRAAWDNSDQQFHVVLSCGTFTYLTYPPFEVEWRLPDGSHVNSTRYKDGSFQLFLTNPVTGGNVTCTIPAHSAATACLPGHVPKPVTDEVAVNSLESRLTVLEAQQAALQAENTQLKGDNAHLLQQVEDLKTLVNETQNKQVSFYASLASMMSYNSGQVVILSSITNNQGDSYSSTTGKFTAPFDGTYFFSASTLPYTSNYYAYAQIIVDGVVKCSIAPGNYFVGGSCSTIVDLTTGQQVWLQSSTSRNYLSSGTSLTGFLLHANP